MWAKLGEQLKLTEKELEEERSHGLSSWMNEELEKIAKLDAIFKNHIQTIAILAEKIPETKRMQHSTKEVFHIFVFTSNSRLRYIFKNKMCF